jgi:hypothetical protein
MTVNILKQIEGEQFSSVTFVQDYLQLHFDGPTINVYNPLTIQNAKEKSSTGDNEFKNQLCNQIGKIVRQVLFQEREMLTILFEDDSSISISLDSKDYRCAEAINAHGFNDGSLTI